MTLPEDDRSLSYASAVVKNVKEDESFSVLSVANQAKKSKDGEIFGIVQDKEGNHQFVSYKHEYAQLR